MATIYDLQDRLTAARQRLSTLNPPKNEFTRRREYESNPVLRQAMDEVSALQAAYDQEYAKFGPGQMPFKSARAGGALSPQPGALTVPQPPSSPAVSAVQPMAPARTPQQDMIGDMDASSVSNSSPIIQAMLNQTQNQPQASYDMPDVQQELRVAQATPVSGPDPFAETYNKTASAFQGALKSAQDEKSDYGWADALIDAGRGLMIAGSPDPAKAAASFADAWSNERAGRKPKVTPLADGAFSMVTKPNGTFEIVRNDQIADYLGQQQMDKFQQALAKTIVGGQVQATVAGQRAAGAEQAKSAGDSAATALSVNELMGLSQKLEGRDDATGPYIGLLPKWIRDVATPAGADIQDRAERIIQASLRQTLGAQFTEKEGARFLERAYNPRLDEKTNAERLRLVAGELQSIQANKDAALEYMKKNGTLEGFKPASPASPPPAPGASGGMSVPGLSPNASKYFR